jgi:hypothetical protein
MMKGLAILILLGFLVFIFIGLMASLTGGNGSFPWGMWSTLAVLAVADIAALVAVIRGD